MALVLAVEHVGSGERRALKLRHAAAACHGCFGKRSCGQGQRTAHFCLRDALGTVFAREILRRRPCMVAPRALCRALRAPAPRGTALRRHAAALCCCALLLASLRPADGRASAAAAAASGSGAAASSDDSGATGGFAPLLDSSSAALAERNALRALPSVLALRGTTLRCAGACRGRTRDAAR
jgi:hypothetical protein